MYRLDRSAFTIQNFESASKQRAYWLSKSPAQRLEAAWYLICAAWNLDAGKPQPMDRNCFSMRKQVRNAAEHI